jgi:hypothetical protein
MLVLSSTQTYKYRVFSKTLRDVRPQRYSSRNGHAEEKHVNRGRDLSYLTVLDMSFLLCLSWLLRSRVRKRGTYELPCPFCEQNIEFFMASLVAPRYDTG